MSLTALEIKQRTFARTIRGYDVSEVNAFLSMIAHDWEFQVGKIKDLEREVKALQDKLTHYQRIEGTLHETLQTARDNAAERLDNARKEAANKVQKAEMEAERLLQEARSEKQLVRNSVLELIQKKNEMVASLDSYLDSAKKSLDRFKADEHHTFKSDEIIAEIPAEKPKKTKPASEEKIDSTVPGVEKLDDLLDDID
jgi:cell division initiation protein